MAKGKARREKFRPPGGKGLSIDIYWGAKFTPRVIMAWRPAVKLTAAVAFHIRQRVRDKAQASDGSRLGPGVLSGEMWKALTVTPASKHGGMGGRAYFARKSKAYRKNRKGEIVLKTQRVATKGRAAKLTLKRGGVAVAEGKVAGVKEKAISVRNRDKALAVSGMSRNAPTTTWRNGVPIVKLGPQKAAAGGHAPISILEPSGSEAEAVASVLLLGAQGLAWEHNLQSPKTKLKGDRRLIQKIRRALGL